MLTNRKHLRSQSNCAGLNKPTNQHRLSTLVWIYTATLVPVQRSVEVVLPRGAQNEYVTCGCAAVHACARAHQHFWVASVRHSSAAPFRLWSSPICCTYHVPLRTLQLNVGVCRRKSRRDSWCSTDPECCGYYSWNGFFPRLLLFCVMCAHVSGTGERLIFSVGHAGCLMSLCWLLSMSK